MARHRIFWLAVTSALLLSMVLGAFAYADGPVAGGAGPDQPTPSKGQVCVDGYVINHRELPVDGTKTNPPLVVQAILGDNALNRAVGQVVATATVGKDGYFKFPSLPAGMLAFQLQLPEGWEGIVPQVRIGGVASTGFANFTESTKCYRIVFKIRRLVTIPVLKWEERLDGTVQPGEDWLITATPIKDPFAKVVTATITGGQTLLTLTPGNWSVAETVKPGWTPLTPPTVSRTVDQYQELGAINPIVFKNREPVCNPKIVVTKVGYGTDVNGEIASLGTLAGWKFTVARADKTMPPITKATDGSGTVTFDGLRPGVYKVTETVWPGWKIREETTTNPQTVTLVDCETAPVTFENVELIGQLRIYGHKWFKAWEKPYKGALVGLSGWTINAKLVGTDVTTSTVTDALGAYEFTAAQLSAAGMGFPGATIDVCEENRENWIHVTPKCVTVKFPYPVPPTYTGVKVDFTNVQDPPVPGAVAPTAAASAGGACSVSHRVVAGDTLAKIAGKYGVTMGGLMRANNIRNADVIYLGQNLCVK